MGGPYFLEYLLAVGFVFLGLLLVCVPRPRKAHTLTPEQFKKQQVKLKKQKVHGGKKKAPQIKIKPKAK